jgi:hypothetical protein
VLNHFHCLGDLMRVKGNTDHVQDAFVPGSDPLFPVALSGVCHGHKLEARCLGIMIADHTPHIFFMAMTPRTEIFDGKQSRRIFVTDLHIIEASRDTRFVNGPHELVRELMVVDQSAVSNRAIKNA